MSSIDCRSSFDKQDSGIVLLELNTKSSLNREKMFGIREVAHEGFIFGIFGLVGIGHGA